MMVGFSKGSRCPAEFNITDALKASGGSGEHTLDVRVYVGTIGRVPGMRGVA